MSKSNISNAKQVDNNLPKIENKPQNNSTNPFENNNLQEGGAKEENINLEITISNYLLKLTNSLGENFNLVMDNIGLGASKETCKSKNINYKNLINKLKIEISSSIGEIKSNQNVIDNFINILKNCNKIYLNVFYLILAIFIFYYSFDKAREKGTLINIGE